MGAEDLEEEELGAEELGAEELEEEELEEGLGGWVGGWRRARGSPRAMRAT